MIEKELRLNVLEEKGTKLDTILGDAEKLLENYDLELNMIGKSCNDKVAKPDEEVGKYWDQSAENQIVSAVASGKSSKRRRERTKKIEAMLIPSVTYCKAS